MLKDQTNKKEHEQSAQLACEAAAAAAIRTVASLTRDMILTARVWKDRSSVPTGLQFGATCCTPSRKRSRSSLSHWSFGMALVSSRS